jgi:hypothetical protein
VSYLFLNFVGFITRNLRTEYKVFFTFKTDG